MPQVLCLLFSFFISSSAWAGISPLFNNGEHCVAYKTRKTLFLVRTVDVVGKNCEVSSQVLPVPGDKYYIEVLVPVDAFKSGEPERDRDVAKILGAGGKTHVVFKSNAFSKEEWNKFLEAQSFELEGEIQVGTEVRPLKVQTALVKNAEGSIEVDGVAKVTFKEVGLKPPQMGFGMMASVKQQLELHFHLIGAKTLGINSLF